MDWSFFAQWEWLVVELIVLALAVFELASVWKPKQRDDEATRRENDEP